MGRAAPWRVSVLSVRDAFTPSILTIPFSRLAAIASNLSKQMDVPTAVFSACRYIQPAIKTAPGFGKGHGPLNHFHSTIQLPFSR